MRFVELKELENKNCEEGEKILLEAGYEQNDAVKDSECNNCDYVVDIYYTLFDESNDPVDIKSFVTYYNYNHSETNDDGSEDFIVKAFWNEMN